jgi:hypothetical protein
MMVLGVSLANAQSQAPQVREAPTWSPIERFRGGFGLSYFFDRCDDDRLGNLDRRALREMLEACPSAEDEKATSRRWADEYEVRMKAEIQAFIAKNGGTLPDYIDDYRTTCTATKARPEYVATREALERYSRGEIDAKAVLAPFWCDTPRWSL